MEGGRGRRKGGNDQVICGMFAKWFCPRPFNCHAANSENVFVCLAGQVLDRSEITVLCCVRACVSLLSHSLSASDIISTPIPQQLLSIVLVYSLCDPFSCLSCSVSFLLTSCLN